MSNLRPRLIPSFYISGYDLVNRILFKEDTNRYIGDPLNTLRIFNQYNPDEIILTDIDAWKKGINYELLIDISEEIFCPFTYGGGIYSYNDAKKIIQLGFEKISFNHAVFENFNIIEKVANNFGCQSVVINCDVIKSNNDYFMFNYRSQKKMNIKMVDLLDDIDLSKVGEILVTNVDRDGSFKGPDFDLIRLITNKYKKPIIYKGGLDKAENIKKCFQIGCSAITSSNFFIMKKKSGGIVFSNPNNFKTN